MGGERGRGVERSGLEGGGKGEYGDEGGVWR